jgi:hypothetical protein
MNILGDNGRPDFDRYLAALVASNINIRNRILILDKNEKPLGELTASDSKVFPMDGGVQVDAKAPVTRLLSLLLLDPRQVLFFEPGVVSQNALFMDRSIQIIRETFVPSIGTGKWVGAPIFTGRITKLDQDGIFTTVEAQGKESLLLPPYRHWRSRTFARNTRITTVIRTLLEDKGETKMVIPPLDRRLHRALSVVPTANTWGIINKLAASMNRHCFYDGEGRFRMRKKPNHVSWRFQYGVDMMTRPSKLYDFLGVRNVAQVRGPRPDEKKEKQIVVTRRLHPNHPMSPESLARNGKKQYLVETLQNDHLKTRVRARDQADNILDASTNFASEYGFDALVIPFLDEFDVVASDTISGDIWKFAMTKWTIPLGVEELMSVNYNKRIRMRTRLRPKKRRAA